MNHHTVWFFTNIRYVCARSVRIHSISDLAFISMFHQFKSLQVIVSALLSSLWPVFNALVIMVLVLGVYSIIGVSFYSEKSEVISYTTEFEKRKQR